MTLFVPYDGSALSRTALLRAARLGTVLEEPVVAATVLPRGNRKYARGRGWLGEDEAYDEETVLDRLRAEVREVAPDAAFDHAVVDRYASDGVVAKQLRRLAREHGASLVVVGSESAGRIVGGLTVGSIVAGDGGYDTLVVSNAEPSRIEKVREADPAPGPTG